MMAKLANKGSKLTNSSVVLDVNPAFDGEISRFEGDITLTGDGGLCLELFMSVASERSRKGLRVGSTPGDASAGEAARLRNGLLEDKFRDKPGVGPRPMWPP